MHTDVVCIGSGLDFRFIGGLKDFMRLIFRNFTILCSEVVQVKCCIDLNWFDYEGRDAYGRRVLKA